MGRIVVSEFVTLDGGMEDPGGSEGWERGGWAFAFDRGPKGDRFKLDEAIEAEAMLLGRKTYDGFAAAWPDRTDDVGFADKMNSMPKYVVSSTLESPQWNNTTVLNGDAVREVTALKEQSAGDLLVYGSAQLVDTLRANDLVDEYRLMVFPTVLGGGKRLFRESADATPLELVETRQTGAVAILILRPARGGSETTDG
jgi:dihydrofolate reductase